MPKDRQLERSEVTAGQQYRVDHAHRSFDLGPTRVNFSPVIEKQASAFSSIKDLYFVSVLKKGLKVTRSSLENGFGFPWKVGSGFPFFVSRLPLVSGL